MQISSHPHFSSHSPIQTFHGSQTIDPVTLPIDTVITATTDNAICPPKSCCCCPVQKALTISEATIPLFDLNDIEKAQGLEREMLIQQFGDGLRDVGFVAIKADALTGHIANVNTEMQKYFAMPLEEKMKDWNSNSNIGYSQQGRETAANAKKADIKETFFIPPQFASWPKHRPEFEAIMKPYHDALTVIASQAMGFIAEYLKEPTEDVTTSISSAYNLLRLAYYPAPKSEDDPEAVWASAHEDLNALTLLPPSTVPGLQLLTKQGEWKAVNVPPGYLILNTGEQLQRKTGGMIQATRHQVLNPGGEYSRQPRYASIFFSSWSNDFSLAPFSSCVEKMTAGMSADEKREYLKNYPDVNVEENLLSRLIEMRTLSNPPEELVTKLHEKGLLKQPPEELVNRFPDLFK